MLIGDLTPKVEKRSWWKSNAVPPL